MSFTHLSSVWLLVWFFPNDCFCIELLCFRRRQCRGSSWLAAAELCRAIGFGQGSIALFFVKSSARKLPAERRESCPGELGIEQKRADEAGRAPLLTASWRALPLRPICHRAGGGAEL